MLILSEHKKLISENNKDYEKFRVFFFFILLLPFDTSWKKPLMQLELLEGLVRRLEKGQFGSACYLK